MVGLHTILFPICFLAVLSSCDFNTFNYCGININHTMCKLNVVGPNCGPLTHPEVKEVVESKLILDLHNKYRQKIALGNEQNGHPGPQPSASNMMEIEWDEELAAVAQRHANQCTFEHDCNECRNVERFKVGQNLFEFGSTNKDNVANWSLPIQSWYDEVALFDASHIAPFVFSIETGHYTQLVWWNTRVVGCGISAFKSGLWWKRLFVCNYGPAGNVMASSMYSNGTSCSECPENTACSEQYDGLCKHNPPSLNEKHQAKSGALYPAILQKTQLFLEDLKKIDVSKNSVSAPFENETEILESVKQFLPIFNTGIEPENIYLISGVRNVEKNYDNIMKISPNMSFADV